MTNPFSVIYGGKIKLKSDFTRLTKVQRSPYHRGVELWNNLLMEIQKKQSKLNFEKSIVKLVP